jgi:hypothetical protein
VSVLIGLVLVGCVLWFCLTETPAVARHREVGEDEPMQTATGRWGE